MIAEMGDATLIGPIARARNNVTYARAPPRPETTPQNQTSPVISPPTKGAMTSSTTRPSGCVRLPSRKMCARRAASPPRKSVSPYATDEPSARRIAVIA